MLRGWESGDENIRALWSKMNGWVYDGFAKSYQDLGYPSTHIITKVTPIY